MRRFFLLSCLLLFVMFFYLVFIDAGVEVITSVSIIIVMVMLITITISVLVAFDGVPGVTGRAGGARPVRTRQRRRGR